MLVTSLLAAAAVAGTPEEGFPPAPPADAVRRAVFEGARLPVGLGPQVVLAVQPTRLLVLPEWREPDRAWHLAPAAPVADDLGPRPARRPGAVPVHDLPFGRSVDGALSLVAGVQGGTWAGAPLAFAVDGGPAWLPAVPDRFGWTAPGLR